MYKNVNSIQHLGVGTADLDASWKFYRTFFGMDIPFFDAVAEAPLMKSYTKDVVINKRAAMILNLQGGCAMEVVQPKSFEASQPKETTLLGDIGIFIGKIKTKDIEKHYNLFLTESPESIVSKIEETPNGEKTFFVVDPNGLYFQILPHKNWYTDLGHVSGSNIGCTLGVSNIDASIKCYKALGYDKVVYDKTGTFNDFKSLKGGKNEFRRVLLTQSITPTGGFGKTIDSTFIELVQVIDRTPKKMWKGRIWGDVGFVHIGFDVKGMEALGEDLTKLGHPFTCDSSNGLMMGKTRIHSTYIEDPDGILLELIEVYKIPILEKFGLFMDVSKRDPRKPYSNIMLKALKFSRIKD